MTHARPTSRPARRGGFSLLELLTVIGILLLLIGLAVIGFRTVGASAKTRATRTAMENCKSLLNEFELTGRIRDVLPILPIATNHWVVPMPAPASTDITTVEVDANNSANILQDTARVINRLRAVPNNQKSLEKTAADRVQSVDFPVLTAAGGNLPSGNAPVLLDGSGNPIYFVPGGGLENVNIGYKGSGDHTATANYDRPSNTIVSPDRRPFWVSPGPDGDLTTGDDNVYSFGD